MHPQSIKARSTPYPTNRARQRTCGYCGRTNQAHTLAADYYCLDCRTPARNLGWTPATHAPAVMRPSDTRTNNSAAAATGTQEKDETDDHHTLLQSLPDTVCDLR